MSLIASNLCDGNTVNTDQVRGNIDTYLRNIGFANIQNIGENGDNIYIAKKAIQYYDKKKEIVGIFLGKCDRWYGEIIKYKEEQKRQTVNLSYSETISEYVNRIVNKAQLLDTMDCSYWVTGYSIGGSIASEVSLKLLQEGKEVYAYTFGAFNTRNNSTTNNEIKNIRNEDDFFIKYITGSKAGQNYGTSIYENLMIEYRDITGDYSYEGNYLFTNYLLRVYNKTEFKNVNNQSDATRIMNNYFLTFNEITNQNDIENYADLAILLNKWAEGNRQAHSIKSYYVLAKCLNGFDFLDYDKVEHYDKVVRLEAPVSDGMVIAMTNTYNPIVFKNEKGQYVNDLLEGYMEIYPDSNERDIKAYFIINGASALNYSLPYGWSGEIYAKSFQPFSSYKLLVGHSINSSHFSNDVLYKKGILRDGHNEYEIRLHYVGEEVPNRPICLEMIQYTDKIEKIREFQYGTTWEANENSIYPVDKENCSKEINYITRDTALIYYMSLSNSGRVRELITRFIQGTINIVAYTIDLKTIAEDIVDSSVIGFSDMVTKYSPTDGGMTRGIWRIAKESYDYYGLLIDPIGYSVGFLKDKLNRVADKIVNDAQYKEKVGEAIYIDSISNEDGDKFIFNEYGLIEKNRIDNYIECESWLNQYVAIGEYGVKGVFR